MRGLSAELRRVSTVLFLLGFVLLMGSIFVFEGCVTQGFNRLADFTTDRIEKGETQQTETCEISVSRLGSVCLKELFGTSKVDKGFMVFWLRGTSTCETPLQIQRSQMSLTNGGVKLYPVDPARVAYIMKRETLPVAALAFGGLVGAVVGMAGMSGVESENKRIREKAGTSSLPEEMAIEPGDAFSVFVYFEPPTKKTTKNRIQRLEGDHELTIILKSGEKQEVLNLRNIPEINPSLRKEGDTHAKNN